MKAEYVSALEYFTSLPLSEDASLNQKYSPVSSDRKQVEKCKVG